MERLSVILFSFYSLAILAESTSTESSAMIETSWDDVHDNSTQVEEHAKDPLYALNNASNAFTISIDNFSSSNIKDMEHLRHNEDKENDADRKEEPSEDLSSHDILLDPSLIPARLTRQTEKSNADYLNLASISSDVKSNNHDNNRSVLPSKSELRE